MDSVTGQHRKGTGGRRAGPARNIMGSREGGTQYVFLVWDTSILPSSVWRVPLSALVSSSKLRRLTAGLGTWSADLEWSTTLNG
ncbi:hypothetical protein R1flu_020723 [Riccia fluitans]|uniref:Uncharacterized protein n=1 Tax=Riccia fluitans TaxID=41844 RepID=A0ABD1ZNU5_9MARC